MKPTGFKVTSPRETTCPGCGRALAGRHRFCQMCWDGLPADLRRSFRLAHAPGSLPALGCNPRQPNDESARRVTSSPVNNRLRRQKSGWNQTGWLWSCGDCIRRPKGGSVKSTLDIEVVWHHPNGEKNVTARFQLPGDAIDFCNAVCAHTEGWLEIKHRGMWKDIKPRGERWFGKMAVMRREAA
jgi:hypothetical protein